MLGVVTVDDVLEMLLPSGWRRDAGHDREGGMTVAGGDAPLPSARAPGAVVRRRRTRGRCSGS